MAIFNFLLLALCTVGIAVAKPIDQSIKQSSINKQYVAYADQAFKIYMDLMYDQTNKRLRATPLSKDPSQYWNTAVAFQSLLNYHDLKQSIKQSNDQSIDQSIDQYDESTVVPLIYQLLATEPTLGQCDAQLRNNYNDDMSWMIHGLTALYDNTKNQSVIDRSVDLHLFIRTSEDSTCCGDMKGGIWWDRTHTQKATAAQAGAALAGLRLMESGASKFTREQWIDWSTAHYDFWLAHMVNQTDYAVCDNIDTKGERRWWSFTYNEGLMLANAVHLYRATNDSRFLTDADGFTQRLYDLSITVSINQTGTVRKGNVLASDGTNCSGDTAQFHQVGYQYLTQYYNLLLELSKSQSINQSIDQSKLRIKAVTLYQFLKDNVDSLMINAFNPKTQTWNCDWSQAFVGGTDGLQGAMNSAVSSISLFAGLDAPPSINNRERLAMQFE